MNNPISVGLGERVVSADPNDILVAYGLGSCIAVGMVDPVRKVCGLLHAVLPERTNGSDPLSGKYVDSGIEGLLNEMIKLGADRRRIIIRIAGGANMLITAMQGNPFDIGTRNTQAARRTFERLSLRVQAEQVGGNSGRTVRMYVAEGRMTVRVVGQKEQDL